MKMRSCTVTTFAADAFLEGELHLKGNLVHHGRFKGRGSVEGILTIGPRGVWEGEAEAPIVFVDGLVVGSVVASCQVVVGSRGRIQGWVRAARLKIHDGGRVDGELFVGKAHVHTLNPRQAVAGQQGETAPRRSWGLASKLA